MTKQRAFWRFFVLGCVLVPLGAAVLLGSVPAAHTVVSFLTAPGTIVTLPLHNLVPGGGWGVMGLIAVANGLVYGLVARLFVRRRNRGRPTAKR